MIINEWPIAKYYHFHHILIFHCYSFQNTEVSLASFPGVATATVCMDHTGEEYTTVLDIPVKNEPYFSIEEDPSKMEYIYQTSLDNSDPLNSEMVILNRLQNNWMSPVTYQLSSVRL